MASAERISPLSGWAARFAGATHADFAIREILFATQVNVRVTGKLPATPGIDIPAKANTWTGDAATSALWLGPNEWLLIAPDGKNAALCASLRQALAGTHHSVVDVSASRTIIEISGNDARTVLAKGCPLDLHASSFTAGQCAQSLLAKSQAIFQCIEARPVFRLLVRNSFAAYVAEWLLDAASEQRASRDAGMLGFAP